MAEPIHPDRALPNDLSADDAPSPSRRERRGGARPGARRLALPVLQDCLAGPSAAAARRRAGRRDRDRAHRRRRRRPRAGRPTGQADRGPDRSASTACRRRSYLPPGSTARSSGSVRAGRSGPWSRSRARLRPDARASPQAPIVHRARPTSDGDPRRRQRDAPDQPHHRARLPGRPARGGRGPYAVRQLVELAASQARRRRYAGRGRPRGGLSLPVPTAGGVGDPARLPGRPFARRDLGGPQTATS